MKQGPGIFAFASAPYGYAVSLLRVSGERAFAACIDATRLPRDSLKSRHAYYCNFYINGQVLDDVLVTFFKAPHSYTGEDMVEIGFHGSPAVAAEATKYFLDQGLQMAEPGEFSRRAFLNGKIDLAQAEGVAALVDAQTLTQAKGARELSTGRFSAYVGALKQQLLGCLAQLEAAMDFPDEDDTKHLSLDAVRPTLEAVLVKISDLIDQYRTGKQILHGIKVAVLGPPNAGKSSLINALLGEDRVLVSEVAGTTRDYIEVPLKLNGEMYWLLDTAGIRETTDAIESAGVELSWKCAKKADLILFLSDINHEKQSDPSDDLLSELRGSYESQKPVWNIGTKADSLVGISAEDAQRKTSKYKCVVSTKDLGGLDSLKGLLANYARSIFRSENTSAQIVFTARHLHHLCSAREALERLLPENGPLPAEEILSFELRDAGRELASIVGSIDNEEVLDKIFSSFCLGK